MAMGMCCRNVANPLLTCLTLLRSLAFLLATATGGGFATLVMVDEEMDVGRFFEGSFGGVFRRKMTWRCWTLSAEDCCNTLLPFSIVTSLVALAILAVMCANVCTGTSLDY